MTSGSNRSQRLMRSWVMLSCVNNTIKQDKRLKKNLVASLTSQINTKQEPNGNRKSPFTMIIFKKIWDVIKGSSKIFTKTKSSTPENRDHQENRKNASKSKVLVWVSRTFFLEF
jgi:hypothetical protein